MVEEKEIINKSDISSAYKEILSLENKKELKINLYCNKYNLQASKLKDIIVSGGTRLIDSILEKIIISDELLDEIIKIQDEITEWTNYLNKEVAIKLRCDDLTPLIVFYKDFRDIKTGKFRTFIEIADLLYSSEATVKRRYYEYKDSLK